MEGDVQLYADCDDCGGTGKIIASRPTTRKLLVD
jgi:RecJ-like exonuclease